MVSAFTLEKRAEEASSGPVVCLQAGIVMAERVGARKEVKKHLAWAWRRSLLRVAREWSIKEYPLMTSIIKVG